MSYNRFPAHRTPGLSDAPPWNAWKWSRWPQTASPRGECALSVVKMTPWTTSRRGECSLSVVKMTSGRQVQEVSVHFPLSRWPPGRQVQDVCVHFPVSMVKMTPGDKFKRSVHLLLSRWPMDEKRFLCTGSFQCQYEPQTTSLRVECAFFCIEMTTGRQIWEVSVNLSL